MDIQNNLSSLKIKSIKRTLLNSLIPHFVCKNRYFKIKIFHFFFDLKKVLRLRRKVFFSFIHLTFLFLILISFVNITVKSFDIRLFHGNFLMCATDCNNRLLMLVHCFKIKRYSLHANSTPLNLAYIECTKQGFYYRIESIFVLSIVSD